MPDGINQFTRRATSVMTKSQAISQQFKHVEIMPIHLLLGMTETDGSIAQAVLQDFEIIHINLAQFFQSNYPASEVDYSIEAMGLSDACQSALELSVQSTIENNDHYIGTEHLLAGIIRLNSPDIIKILSHFKVSPKAISDRIRYYLDEAKSSDNKQD